LSDAAGQDEPLMAENAPPADGGIPDEASAAGAGPADTMADGEGTGPVGSSRTDEPLYLIVARILRPHGVQGELACEIVTEFPERFRQTKRVYLVPSSGPGSGEPLEGGVPQPYAVEQARLSQHRGHAEVILNLTGVADRDSAEALRGWLVQVPASEAWKLPRGRFYWHQIVGLRVVTTEGEEIGTVSEILETGANDVYVVKADGRERLIPAIKQVVKKIAPEQGEMVVELLPGL
jgi:16S rRNA processing protein RimM